MAYHHRDESPEYYSGGGGGGGFSRPYVSGANPAPPSVPFAPPPARAPPPGRIHNPASPNEYNRLVLPDHHAHRPLSASPHALAVPAHRRSHSRHEERGRDRDRDRAGHFDESVALSAHRSRSESPISRARHTLNNTFSQSNSGIGVGVLGAIVGGLAAREASEAAGRSRDGNGRGYHDRNRDPERSESDRAALLSTLVGAAVGGLGANALEKRLETNREKTKIEQEKWEKKWGKEHGGDRRDGSHGKKGHHHRRDANRDRGRDRDRDRDRDRVVTTSRRNSRRRKGDAYDEDSEIEYIYDRRTRRNEERSRHRN